MVCHRDERFRDDPARWLDVESDRLERCIGRQFATTEAQLVLATLLSEWRFEREYDDLALAPAVTLKPETDIGMTPRR